MATQQNQPQETIPPQRPHEDQRPAVFEDNNEPNLPAGQHQQEPLPPPEPEEPEGPQPYVDPRLEFGRKAAARRAEERRVYEPDDEKFVPPSVQNRGDPGGQDDDNDDQKGAAPQAAPSDSGEQQPQTIAIKVNGQTMDVSREELIAYAELDPDDDPADYTEKQLVKYAQKNLASNQMLERSRETLRKAKEWHPPEQQQPTPGQQQTPDNTDDGGEQPTIDELHDEYIEAVQFGDKDEAKEKYNKWQDAIEQQRQQQEAQTRASQQQQQQLTEAFTTFEAQNSDLFEDEIVADVFQAESVRAAVRQIQKVLPQLTDDVARNEIYNAPNPALVVANVADRLRAAGHTLPSADQIMQQAATAVRTRFNMPAPTQQPPVQQQNEPAADDRLARKRQLAPQPRSGSAPAQPVRPAATRESDPSVLKTAVQRIAEARGQRLP